MYCKDIMIDRNQVITVTSEFTLSKVLDRMRFYGHRTLPVVNMGRYQGVVDRNAIFEHVYIKRDIDLDVATAGDVIRTNIQIVYASDFIEKAAIGFRNHRYQFLPVLMDDTADQFMGIMPMNTLMDTFSSALGLGQPAHRLTLEMSNYRGELAKLTRALMQSGANITSFVTVDHRDPTNIHSSPQIKLVLKFEGDLDLALASCRAQGARVTHIDRFEG